MNIKTKASIGQKVYVMHQEQIKEVRVASINVQVENTELTVRYKVKKSELNQQGGTESFFEHEVYTNAIKLTEDLMELIQYLPKAKEEEGDKKGIDELSKPDLVEA